MELWQKINQNKKKGRPTSFESPDVLWNAACEYFRFTDNNSWKKVTPMIVDKKIEYAKSPIKLPYTLQGLELFLGVSHSYFRTMKSLNANTDDPIKLAFLAVVSEIEKTIYRQQFDGASAGVFNANIIARALGLSEKTVNENINMNSVPMTKDEIKKLNDELENDV